MTATEETFNDLYRRYHTPLLCYLHRIVGPVEAEDVAQDTWEKVSRALARTPLIEGKVSAWLYVIASRTAFDCLRHRRYLALHHDVLRAEHEEVPEPIDGYKDIYSDGRLARVLASVKPRDRRLLLLVGHGYEREEIARLLDITPGTIKMRLYRAREAGRAALAEEEVSA